ncbi:MAG: carboxypeptidase regulatory-like domain-containing protein [Candidatus Acidiferrales bacterium]
MNCNRVLVIAFALLLAMSIGSKRLGAQATVGTGSIEGVITDATGAVIPNAKVTITNRDTGRTIAQVSTSAGTFNVGSLIPGNYAVRVEEPHFKTSETTVVVQVGVIATVSPKLEVGASTAIVEVTGEAVAVNTEQAQVAGVLNAEQIENLPVNGRNFLDLAQLEPGVQIQDGQNFDPTKTGFSSISFGGRFGRTARIEVDGLDVSDETVGTTTTNVPASAIQEFQLAQSSLDLSNELTSSGAVNVTTKSGTNSLHGGAFGLFRDSSMAAALPGGASFQRSQYGGDFGGPIIKDKLFFFLDGERTLQHAQAGVPVAEPFSDYTGTFQSPFLEDDLVAKVDWQATKNLHLFYRFDYFKNYLVPSFGAASYSFFSNSDRTRTHVGGADWTTGSFTHSVRVEYLKFRNNIGDAVRGSGAPFSDYPVSLEFSTAGLYTGPSPDAPQATPQSDRQAKYDGSKTWGAHVLRYGISINHIQGGGFASFFGYSPLVYNFQFPTSYTGITNVTCPNGDSGMACPLNYQVDYAYIGNGLGASTEKPAFGFPAGGLGPDNRLGIYIGDSWKIRPNLTVTYGVRYSRDTGRTDSDLPALPELNAVLPGYGNRVNQPNHNFGPQIGVAWDPKSDGKTVIRAGIGIYYENGIFNNVLFDRPPRLAAGSFLQYTPACSFGQAVPVSFADGSVQTIPGGNTTCSSAIGAPDPANPAESVAQGIADFQNAFQAAAAAHPGAANPSYIGTEIQNGVPLSALFYPGYQTPRSTQMNIGFQRELHPGMVLSVDFLRNIATHYLLQIDANHTGDAAYLNQSAAANAINTTNASFGCGTGMPGITCAIGAGASITDYAGNGLDSPSDLGVGACNGPSGIGVPCAFGGINPNIGPAPFLFPDGRSVYNALDVEFKQNVRNPFRGVKYLNFTASYTFSRFVNSGSSTSAGGPAGGDQDFINSAIDNRNPLAYTGPGALDRTHQLNLGGYADLPLGFRVGLISHIWSPLASTATLSTQAGAGSIFQTDFTGDGTVNDLLPKSYDPTTGQYTLYNVGSFGRNLSTGGLATAINNYNNTIAGQAITPAGTALVNAGLITPAQLIALGATPPSISAPPSNEVGLDWLRAFDLQVGWVGHFFQERLTVEPSVGIFNLFNFVNYDAPGYTLNGALNGQPGSINGTTPATRSNRIGAGSGVFAFGAPRAVEFGLKFNF